MSGKRRRVVISLEEKCNAIRRLDNGETLRRVAEDLGVGVVTVGDWKRKREEIENYVYKSVSAGGGGSCRKTLKKGDYEQTSEALFQWFSDMKNIDIAVSGPMLRVKALEIHKSFKDGDDNFTASDGWLDRWKNRFGLKTPNASEQVSVWVKPELVVEDVAEEDEDVTSQNSLSEELENNTSDSVPQTPAYNYNQCEVPPPGVATAEEDIGKHETVDHPHHHHPNNHNPLYPKSLHPLYPKSLHPLHPKSLHPLHPNHHLPPPPAADVPHLPTVNGTDLSPPPMLPSILPGGFKGEGEETRNLSDQQLQRLVLLEQLSYYRKAQMLVDFQMKRELSRNFNL